ncbi:retinitis pigmentosa 1-like 1 protein [Excalfactoria chinensis]|uniref:retinitis pigmentosa 1-like 1 protein n=1 Tax=Excalfactoria chinensis TaxID=46218 RepID=UPI003B3BD4DA
MTNPFPPWVGQALLPRVPLPFGVRTITTPRGIHCISELDQLEDGGCYLCSDKKYVKPINIASAGHRPGPPRSGRPSSTLRRAAQEGRLDDYSTPFTQHGPRIPKKITLVKNGETSFRRSIILNRRNARSFKTLLDEISEILQFPVKKLFTVDGKKIDSMQALLHCPNVLVCVGREPFKPVSMENLRKHSVEKLPDLAPRSNGNNVNENNENNGAPFSNNCSHPKPGDLVHSLVNDDIEKRVHVNKDGSLSVEMKVRFRLLNDETLQWSTQIRKSNLMNQMPCEESGLEDSGLDPIQKMNPEASSEADDSLYPCDVDSYMSKLEESECDEAHCHSCGKKHQDYDIWKNPMHTSQREEPSVRSTWHTRSSCSSTSSRRRVIHKKKASVDSLRTTSSEEFSEHIVQESSSYSETIENRVAYRSIKKCTCRSDLSTGASNGEDQQEYTRTSTSNSQRPSSLGLMSHSSCENNLDTQETPEDYEASKTNSQKEDENCFEISSVKCLKDDAEEGESSRVGSVLSRSSVQSRQSKNICEETSSVVATEANDQKDTKLNGSCNGKVEEVLEDTEVQEELNDLMPSSLPNTSPEEVVQEWLSKIPSETLLMKYEMEDDAEEECIEATAEIMKALLSSKHEAKFDRSNSLPEVSPTMGRKLSNSATVLITCLASLQLLDEESEDPSDKSKCLNKPRYMELLNIFQALWFGQTAEKSGPSSSQEASGQEKSASGFKVPRSANGEFTPMSSSGVDVSSGSGGSGEEIAAGARDCNLLAQKTVEFKSDGQVEDGETATELTEAEEQSKQEERSSRPSTACSKSEGVEKANSAREESLVQDQRSNCENDQEEGEKNESTENSRLVENGEQEAEAVNEALLKENLEEATTIETNASDADCGTELKADTEEHLEKGSTKDPEPKVDMATSVGTSLVQQNSVDPDPVWVLRLLKKIEKEFMAHYVNAMNELKVRWNLQNNQQMDEMILELKEEVSKRIQRSIEKELKKIKSRAGTKMPRPPDGPLKRESTLQTEQRRRRLQTMHKKSFFSDKTGTQSRLADTSDLSLDVDEDGAFSAAFEASISEQPSEEEYCPCDTCVRKKMASKPTRNPVMATNAPVVKAFDLQQILRGKKDENEEACVSEAAQDSQKEEKGNEENKSALDEMDGSVLNEDAEGPILESQNCATEEEEGKEGEEETKEEEEEGKEGEEETKEEEEEGKEGEEETKEEEEEGKEGEEETKEEEEEGKEGEEETKEEEEEGKEEEKKENEEEEEEEGKKEEGKEEEEEVKEEEEIKEEEGEGKEEEEEVNEEEETKEEEEEVKEEEEEVNEEEETKEEEGEGKEEEEEVNEEEETKEEEGEGKEEEEEVNEEEETKEEEGEGKEEEEEVNEEEETKEEEGEGKEEEEEVNEEEETKEEEGEVKEEEEEETKEEEEGMEEEEEEAEEEEVKKEEEEAEEEEDVKEEEEETKEDEEMQDDEKSTKNDEDAKEDEEVAREEEEAEGEEEVKEKEEEEEKEEENTKEEGEEAKQENEEEKDEEETKKEKEEANGEEEEVQNGEQEIEVESKAEDKADNEAEETQEPEGEDIEGDEEEETFKCKDVDGSEADENPEGDAVEGSEEAKQDEDEAAEDGNVELEDEACSNEEENNSESGEKYEENDEEPTSDDPDQTNKNHEGNSKSSERASKAKGKRKRKRLETLSKAVTVFGSSLGNFSQQSQKGSDDEGEEECKDNNSISEHPSGEAQSDESSKPSKMYPDSEEEEEDKASSCTDPLGDEEQPDDEGADPKGDEHTDKVQAPKNKGGSDEIDQDDLDF